MANPLRVLLVNDKLSMDGKHPNSIAYLFGLWIDFLDKNKVKPTVCTLRSPDPGGDYLEKKGIKVHYIGLGKYSFRTISKIESIIDSDRIELLHLHGYRGSNFGRIAARRKGIRNIVHEHAVLPFQFHQFIMDYCLRSYTDSAVAVSHYVKNFLNKKRCIHSSRIEVMGNGIDLSRHVPLSKEKRDEVRCRYSLDNDRILIGVVGRLREEKGVESLIRSIPYVLKKHPTICVLIAGEGPERDKYQRLIAELGLGEVVRLLGHVDAIYELQMLFDVQVIPSLSEGFGLCLIEAMASRIPIVASYVGGLAEIGVDGENVLFARPKDHCDIANKILAILRDHNLAQKIADQACEDSKRYSIQNNVLDLLKLYYKVINRQL